jgi:transposase-like protein
LLYKSIKERCYAQFVRAKNKGEKMNFTTDMLAHYKKGFDKYFRNVATLTHGVPIKCRRHGLIRNNNSIERDHQYSRAMEKTGRGHKDLNGVSGLLDIGDAYYNFIDTQRVQREKAWRTPAQRAKIGVKFGENYQLLKLIKHTYA